MKKIICTFGAIAGLLMMTFAQAEAQPNNLQQERYYTEWQDQLRFLSNPQAVETNVAKIKYDLVQYSRKSFPIYPVPNTGTIGAALDGGVILLDGGTLGKHPEVLAFWLAHEWGHQDLSHSRNIYSTPQAVWTAFFQKTLFTSSNEDAADKYAARFLASKGYGLKEVLENLCALPPSTGNHSPGQTRAQNVADVYTNARNLTSLNACNSGMHSVNSDTIAFGAARNTIGESEARVFGERRNTIGESDAHEVRSTRNTVEDSDTSDPGVVFTNNECLEGNALKCADNGKTRRAFGKTFEAIILFKKGCDAKIAEACSELASTYFVKDYDNEDDALAYKYSKIACDLKSGLGCFILGISYEFGRGVNQNDSHALSAYERGCKADDLSSCVEAGTYLQWEKFGEDYTQAARYFQKACDGKAYKGCWKLATLYHDGDGVAESHIRALKYRKLACDGGFAKGCYSLGSDYGRRGDTAKALAAYKKGCDGGEAGSCFDYGRYHALGYGTVKNEVIGLAIIRQVCGDDYDYTAQTFACRWLDENEYDR